MPWERAFNFRGSAAYVDDRPPETYSLGEQYPVRRNGVTFGWVATNSNTRDRSTTVDRRLAGVVFQSNGGAGSSFQVDLPGPGLYDFRLALGDEASSHSPQYCQLTDTDTGAVLLTLNLTTVNSSAAAGDATGNVWGDREWASRNRPVRLALGWSVRVRIGSPTGTDVSSIEHLSLRRVESRPTPTRAAVVASAGGGSTAGAGSAAGAATASGVGASLAPGAGSADGLATVSGAGPALTPAAGSATGAASAAGVGASPAAGAGAATGAASAAGVGASPAPGVGSATGLATATGVGPAVAAAVGSADGAATAAGVGASLAPAAGSATGGSAAAGSGPAVAAAAGSATGLATATGVGTSLAAGSAVGTADGSATATGVGASLAPGIGSATGAATASGVGPAVAASAGSATGLASAAGARAAVAAAAGSATGGSTAAGVSPATGPRSTVNFAYDDPGVVRGGTFTPGTFDVGAHDLVALGPFGELRTSARGTDCTLSYLAGTTGPMRYSVDGGAFTTPTLTDGFVWSTLTLFSGLPDDFHDVVIQALDHNNFWVETDTHNLTFQLSGAAPALSVPAGWASSGRVTLVSDQAADSPLLRVEGQLQATNQGYPVYISTYGGVAFGGGSFRWRGSMTGVRVWSTLYAPARYRLFRDGVSVATAAPTDPALTFGWGTIASGLDGSADHEWDLVFDDNSGNHQLYELMLIGGSGFGDRPAARRGYAVLGDSISAPYTPPGGNPTNAEGYVARLARAAKHYQLNAGVFGSTVSDVSTPMPGRTAQVTHAADSLDLILFMGGQNDLAESVPLATYQSAYAASLANLAAGAPGVPVVCVGVLPSNGPGPSLIATYNDAAKAAVAAFVAASPGVSVRFVDTSTWGDLFAPGGNYTLYYVDNDHLNAAGHALLAGLVRPVLDASPWATLAEALAAQLAADPVLSAAFPGGFSYCAASRDTRWPYAVFHKVGVRPVVQVVGRPERVDHVDYAVEVFSRAGADRLEKLVDLVKRRVRGGPEWGGPSYAPRPLSWSRGRESHRFPPGPGFEGTEFTTLGEQRSPGGKDVFRSLVPVTFLVTTW